MQRRHFTKVLFGFALGCVLTTVSTSAVARRGRPASPNSVAGVHRRHRRRRRRRIRRHMRLSSLPSGCRVTRVRGGVTYYHCSGIWYRPVYQGTTVVYIVEDIDSGANTEVAFDD